MFSVDEILNATGGKLLPAKKMRCIAGISIDSRTIKKDELFVAIKGRRFDGHDFVKGALKNGAWGAVVSDITKYNTPPLIKVKDTLRALGDIAACHRKKFTIPAIGITGSNGKTTVKDMVSHLLAVKYNVLKNRGTENNLVGLPLTLLHLRSDHDIMALEMGTNRFGEIRRLAEILKPNVGIITNIGPSHLEFLKDEEGVLQEKARLVTMFAKDDLVILNGDDLMLRRLRPKCRVIRFGLGANNDFYAADIKSGTKGLCFTLNGRYPIKMALFGEHNIYNGLAAIAVAFHFKIDPTSIAQAFLSLRPPQMRMELKKIKGISVINDAYNSNPVSLSCAIKAFSGLKAKGKKILITGDMLELGKASRVFHREAGRLIAASSIDRLITVGRDSRYTALEANHAGFRKTHFWSCGDPKEAAKILRRIVKSGDAVLVKGSRAMAMEKIVEGL